MEIRLQKRLEDVKAEQEERKDEGGDILIVIEKEGGGDIVWRGVEEVRPRGKAAVMKGSWTLDSRAETPIKVNTENSMTRHDAPYNIIFKKI